MEFKKMGVLGGMGPEASASFYYKVIRYCQKKYGSVQDTDFPPIVIYSLPLEGFDESGVKNEKAVLEQLQEGIKTLEDAGCDFVVIPCNSVHCFINNMRKKCSVPIISIIEETAKKVHSDGNQTVGILGSESTLKSNLYQDSLDYYGVKCLAPHQNSYQYITELIFEVMKGKVKPKTKNQVISEISNMVSKGTEGIILGCTELPLAITEIDSNVKLYDTLQILAESAVEYSLNHHPKSFIN